MKKYIAVLLALGAMLFAPLAVVQADPSDMMRGFSSGEMNRMMDDMMNGRLSPDKQMEFYQMMGQDQYWRGGHMNSMMWGNIASYSAMYWAHKIMWLLFSVLVLILLFLLNVVLYQKATGMMKRKK